MPLNLSYKELFPVNEAVSAHKNENQFQNTYNNIENMEFSKKGKPKHFRHNTLTV